MLFRAFLVHFTENGLERPWFHAIFICEGHMRFAGSQYKQKVYQGQFV